MIHLLINKSKLFFNFKTCIIIIILLFYVFFIYSRHENDEKISAPDIDENPHLKNIDPKMVEMIKNEIIECKNPITWDDISGLQFAKNTIQVCLA